MTTRTILIADDEPHLIHILSYNLKRTGAVVHVATNGEQCVELAKIVLPDLIISDYQMPLLDGLAAAIQLRADSRTANIPVLMLTARGHRLTAAQLAQTQIRAVLPKPFSARQLLAKINELLVAPVGVTAA